MALEVAHRLVDELDLVGTRICRRSTFRGRQMLAVDASESQAARSDVAGYASLLASGVGIRLVGEKEFQLLTHQAHGWAEAIVFVVRIGHWHRQATASAAGASIVVFVIAIICRRRAAAAALEVFLFLDEIDDDVFVFLDVLGSLLLSSSSSSASSWLSSCLGRP